MKNHEDKPVENEGTCPSKGYVYCGPTDWCKNGSFYLSQILLLVLALWDAMDVFVDSDRTVSETIRNCGLLLIVVFAFVTGRKAVEQQRVKDWKERQRDKKNDNQFNTLFSAIKFTNLKSVSALTLPYGVNDRLELKPFIFSVFPDEVSALLNLIYKGRVGEVQSKLASSKTIQPRDQLFINAEIKYQQKKYSDAYEKVKTLMNTHSEYRDFFMVTRLRGMILQQCARDPSLNDGSSNLKQSIDLFTKLIEDEVHSNYPFRGDLLNKRGRSYLYLAELTENKADKQTNLKKAESDFVNSILWYPNFEWNQNNLGATKAYLSELTNNLEVKCYLLYEAIGHYQAGARIYRSLSDDQKTYDYSEAVALYNCADAYLELMKRTHEENRQISNNYYELSMYYSEESIKIDPNYLSSYRNKMEVQFEAGHLLEARKCLTTILGLPNLKNQKNTNALFYLYYIGLKVLKAQLEQIEKPEEPIDIGLVDRLKDGAQSCCRPGSKEKENLDAIYKEITNKLSITDEASNLRSRSVSISISMV